MWCALQAFNVVKEPSMIRVESDELTYPMHIILRSAPLHCPCCPSGAHAYFCRRTGRAGHTVSMSPLIDACQCT